MKYMITPFTTFPTLKWTLPPTIKLMNLFVRLNVVIDNLINTSTGNIKFYLVRTF